MPCCTATLCCFSGCVRATHHVQMFFMSISLMLSAMPCCTAGSTDAQYGHSRSILEWLLHVAPQAAHAAMAVAVAALSWPDNFAVAAATNCRSLSELSNPVIESFLTGYWKRCLAGRLKQSMDGSKSDLGQASRGSCQKAVQETQLGGRNFINFSTKLTYKNIEALTLRSIFGCTMHP